MNQGQVHQYVIEYISGSLKARQNTKRLLWQSFATAVFVSVVIAVTDLSNSTSLGLAFGVLLAGIPFGVIAQRTSLSIALSRDYLKLKRFLIGKKGYIAPKSHVLHEHADLFAIASSLICHEPFLAPHTDAAAWHTQGVLTDLPGIAACTGWYGKDSKPVVFLYGESDALLELCEDIWDLGHVRKLAPSDTERYKQTVAGWGRQHLIPVALAYAPLSETADPANLTTKDVQKDCLLLGAVGLEGSRGYGQSVPLAPANSVTRAVEVQTILTISLAFYTGISVITGRFLDKIPVANLALLLTFTLFISPLLLAVFSWDQAQNARQKLKPSSFSSIVGTALLISSLSYGTSLLYEYTQTITDANRVVIHQSAAAVGILTFGLCLLLQIIFSRTSFGTKTKPTPYNPLFMLGAASTLLLVLMITYASGPLLLGGTLMAVGASLAFVSIHQIQAYANRHHTRDHIIKLLESSR